MANNDLQKLAEKAHLAYDQLISGNIQTCKWALEELIDEFYEKSTVGKKVLFMCRRQGCETPGYPALDDYCSTHCRDIGNERDEVTRLRGAMMQAAKLLITATE